MSLVCAVAGVYNIYNKGMGYGKPGACAAVAELASGFLLLLAGYMRLPVVENA